MSKTLQIVSFDVPYPPNYGGIIDVFYRIEALYKLGIEIHLHTFLYDGKKEQPELKKYCKEVYYYDRKNSFLSLFSVLPFRLVSRKNKLLHQRLRNAKTPILFEGINTIYPLYKFNLKNCYVRAHNIEDNYFLGLAKAENNFFKKLFNYCEAFKLSYFEKNLQKATKVLTISKYEQAYFSQKFSSKALYLPVFHRTRKIINHSKKEDFILFHGDLRVADNIKACLFLIDVYKDSSYKFVIATSINTPKIKSEIKRHKNISIANINSESDLVELLQKAHINTLFTFQKTGIKLKLLNVLYNGKFIIANSLLVEDTGLEDTCVVANTKEEILLKTADLFNSNFKDSETEKRIEKLKPFSPQTSAEKLVALIFPNK